MAMVNDHKCQGAASPDDIDPEAWDIRVSNAYARTLQEIELIEPGALVLYHEGHLACDMEKDPEVAGVAAAFQMAALDLGRGFLLQQRIDEERCQYFFRRAH